MSRSRSRPDTNNIGVASQYGKATSEWVQWHVEDILMLPEPGVGYEWDKIDEREDTPDPVPSKIKNMRNAFQQKNVIRRVKWTRNKNGRVTLWETIGPVYDFAQALWNSRTENGTLPKCDHKSGFTVIDPDADEYECIREDCNAKYNRKTIERVFF